MHSHLSKPPPLNPPTDLGPQPGHALQQGRGRGLLRPGGHIGGPVLGGGGPDARSGGGEEVSKEGRMEGEKRLFE